MNIKKMISLLFLAICCMQFSLAAQKMTTGHEELTLRIFHLVLTGLNMEFVAKTQASVR